MKKHCSILILTLALLLTAGLSACNLSTEKPGQNKLKNPINITVEVLHGDGSTKIFLIQTDCPTLRGALEQENLVKGEEGPYGLYLHEVDGERAVYEENGAYWAIYLGEEQAMTGVDGISLAEGIVYKLVWTKG